MDLQIKIRALIKLDENPIVRKLIGANGAVHQNGQLSEVQRTKIQDVYVQLLDLSRQKGAPRNFADIMKRYDERIDARIPADRQGQIRLEALKRAKQTLHQTSSTPMIAEPKPREPKLFNDFWLSRRECQNWGKGKYHAGSIDNVRSGHSIGSEGS